MHPNLITRITTDDTDYHVLVEMLDGERVLASSLVDLGPNPTWPSASEQADLVADAVRTAWMAAYYAQTGN